MPEDTQAKCKRWHAALERFQQEIWKDGPEQPEYLYHYSTLSNIRSILSSHELWLFDVCTMKNDPGDGKYWIGVFYSVLRHFYVPEWLENHFMPGKALGLGTAWYEYVSCFSERLDLQEQWEDFADHGTGCAIQISFQHFMDACHGGKLYAWTPMAYDAQEQKIHAEATVQKAVELYVSECSDMTYDEAWKHFWAQAAFSFLWCGTRFKDPRFRRQHEWRIFLSRVSEHLDFQVSADGRRYMRWPFPKGVVAGLVKGPSCNCSDEELKAMLADAGYPQNVRSVKSLDSRNHNAGEF